MRLRDWLRDFDVTAQDASEQLGITPSMVYALLNGHSRPSLDLAFKIEEMTEGAVRARDWRTEK